MKTLLSIMVAMVILTGVSGSANATSQWARKTGLACTACHTVFPRLNSYGEKYLKNGYVLSAKKEDGEKSETFLDKVDNLLGFRLNLTPIAIETHSFQQDSGESKSTRYTIGNPNWIQFFAAGQIYQNISFFSELEYSRSSFKFNWFYFNFTNLMGSKYMNFQVGNISPLEFASYPNRLPQLPNLKGEGFLIKSSDGKGEESIDMSSARSGVQYYGYNDYATVYAGISPGTNGQNVNQTMDYWGGLVFTLPDNISDKFEGSSATIHYYKGSDSKFSGDEATPQKDQQTNDFTRISPQFCVRYLDKVDVQFAYIMGTEKNRSFLTTGAQDFKYNGIALEAGYMPSWKYHFGLHYDKYSSKDKAVNASTGKNAPILDYQRVVPAATYVINQNIRFTLYYEKNLTGSKSVLSADKVDKMTVNMRVMF